MPYKYAAKNRRAIDRQMDHSKQRWCPYAPYVLCVVKPDHFCEKCRYWREYIKAKNETWKED